jgi:hypothetical protein
MTAAAANTKHPARRLPVISVPRGDLEWCRGKTWDELSLMAERGERGFGLHLVMAVMDRAQPNHAFLEEGFGRMFSGRWTLYSQGWDATTPEPITQAVA